MTDLLAFVAGLLLIVGAAFTLTASLGMLRLPDLFTRMHAASKAGAVGGGLILIAVAVSSLDAAVALRALFGVVFLLLTTPISAHLLARASYFAGQKNCKQTVLDELESKTEQTPAT